MLRSMQSFVQLAMFDLDLESTMGGWREAKIFTPPPHPTPLLIFLLLLTPKVQISFSPQPSVAIKIKDDSHNFAKKILSTCFPKLHLPCRLMEN